jgi:hypothetical protein
LNRSLLASLVVVALTAVVVVVVLRKSDTPRLTSESLSRSAVELATSSAASNIPSPVATATNPIVSLPEPPFVVPAVATPGLSNVVDRSKDSDERVRGLTSGKVPEVKNRQDLDTLAKQLSNPKEDRVVRHEIVNLLVRSNYPELEPLLFKILENPAEGQDFRAWAVQHIGGLLTNPGDIPVSPDLLSRVRKILADKDLHVRREALLALSRANDQQTLEAAKGMLESPSPEFDGMRDMAIRIAQTRNQRDQIRLIRPYLTSTNDTLRIAAIDTLEGREGPHNPYVDTSAAARC